MAIVFRDLYFKFSSFDKFEEEEVNVTAQEENVILNTGHFQTISSATLTS